MFLKLVDEIERQKKDVGTDRAPQQGIEDDNTSEDM